MCDKQLIWLLGCDKQDWSDVINKPNKNHLVTLVNALPVSLNTLNAKRFIIWPNQMLLKMHYLKDSR